MKYILKCLHKSINSVTPIHVFLCLYSFTKRKRFYMYQARFIYRITSINLLCYSFNMPRIYWTIIVMRCHAVLGNLNLSRLWGDNTLLWFFLTSLNTLITRCTRSKARCTLLNIAAHSWTSLHTLQSRCTLLHTLPNLAAHSQTSLYTPQPRSLHTTQHCCTLSNVAAHCPNSL